MSTITILFIGDVVGQPGQVMFQKWVPTLKEKHKADMVIVNGENSAANGRGISPKQVRFFKHIGADVITSGNHIWAQKDCYETLKEKSDLLLRPINYPSACPGKGYTLVEIGDHTVAVVNVQGRVFMHADLDCPFLAMDSLLTMLQTKTKIIFVDFHAEATSEKQALAYYLDGRVSAVVGTHTHIQTADEYVLPGGTAMITDVGCSSALHSSIGMTTSVIIEKFLTQMPQKFTIEKSGPYVLQGVVVTIDTESGKATGIERIRLIDEDAQGQLGSVEE